MAFAYYMFPKEVNAALQGLSLAPEDKSKEQKKELFDMTAKYEHLDDPVTVKDTGNEKPVHEEEATMVYTMSAKPSVPEQQAVPAAPTVQVVDPPPAVKAFVGISSTIILLIIFWLLFSVAAIIYSLVCVGKSGSVAEKVIGVALALFFGPFYFIYLVANKSYCNAIVSA